MPHIEINNRQVTIDHATTLTMAPNSQATVEGVTLRCDKHGIVNVEHCEGGSYSLHQKMGHLPAGVSVTGVVHRQAPRPPSGTPIPRQRKAGPYPPAAATPTDAGVPDLADFPAIAALDPDRLLEMIETVYAAQVALADGRADESARMVNEMAHRLGIAADISELIKRFPGLGGNHQ
ncbi:hypothetical protein [Glycomyces buryatensis]|uniref:Uncharacterized protein n=1 Tax=Glycomyces buryatensis TaxID=2570927 RepID=A0A4S8Q8Q2_9ACTN|nr:hypothetical protein [Glycomyces buryatensis]THV40560.1 hypothetical protein FAB82_14940 [Glycomyces buryatensis]